MANNIITTLKEHKKKIRFIQQLKQCNRMWRLVNTKIERKNQKLKAYLEKLEMMYDDLKNEKGA